MNSGLIVLEGIDGSGKSTVARLVADALSKQGKDVQYWDKRSTSFDSVFARRQMEAIKVALWDYPKDVSILELGDMHWLSLMVSWLSAIDELVIRPSVRNDRLVIVDNWYYKFAARFLLKDDFDPAIVHTIFSLLSKPSRVIFLDVDPSVSAMRKNGHFLPSECGVLDNPHLVSRERFIAYQSRVRNKLLGLCEKGTSIIVDATFGDVSQITQRVLQKLSLATA